jgi:hypothetical protein
LIPDEYVLRIVHKSHYTASKTPPIQRTAFTPNKSDTDGISFYRERIVRPRQLITWHAATKNKPINDYYVARLRISEIMDLRVEEMKQLRLTFVPTVGELIGHVIIPEITWDAYEKDEKGFKVLARELAKLANKQIIPD